MRHQLAVDFDRFVQSLHMAAPVSIRVNPGRQFNTAGLAPVPWCRTGHYLRERPTFTLDPHLHAGGYYVQEASSMFLEWALRHTADLNAPLRVLDLCAAPGGKSTHLLSLLSADSLLVSNEVIRSRASVLAENIEKWGHANVVVTSNDPEDFAQLPGFFDVILLDAPCSGEGLFRKDTAARNEWSEENAHLCSLRQRRIVSDVWPALKEGGWLIYATCTYNPEENEQNLRWLSQQHTVEFMPIPHLPAGVEEIRTGHVVGYRLMPHHVEGEGLFLAVMRKLEAAPGLNSKRKKIASPAKIGEARNWLHGEFDWAQHHDLLLAWPSAIAAEVDLLSQRLNTLQRGMAVASVKHNKLVPEHALALSKHLARDRWATQVVELEEALIYLRKESLPPGNSPRGFALIVFEGNVLGWINQLGNRINNLYPANWRIRMRSENPNSTTA